jgi:hypothetical protein
MDAPTRPIPRLAGPARERPRRLLKRYPARSILVQLLVTAEEPSLAPRSDCLAAGSTPLSPRQPRRGRAADGPVPL